MKILESELDKVKHLLIQLWQKGARWVAYEKHDNITSSSLTGFSSVSMANAFCNDMKIEGRTPVFKSISTVLENLMIYDGALTKLPADENKLAEQIAHHGLMPVVEGENLSKSLQTCEIYPVLQSRLSSPLEQVGQYTVVQQCLSLNKLPDVKGEVPEIIARYDNYNQAMVHYENKCEMNAPLSYGERPNLLLMGEYKGQTLQIGDDGFPDKDTGLIFSMARSVSDAQYPTAAYQVTQMNNPQTLSLKLDKVFAQFDAHDNTIHLMDGDLQPLLPGKFREKIDTSHFSFGDTVEVLPGPMQLLRQQERDNETVIRSHRNRLS